MPYKGLSKHLAIALEAVGCSVVVAGIVIEVIMRAPIGYIIITSGALAVAFGTMVFTKLLRGNRSK